MTRTRMTLAIAALLALAGSAAAQGIRTVADEGEPIAIVTHVRHTTTVVVPMSETIVDVVAGDAEYWDVSASGHVAYVKPLEAAAASNVTLVAASGRVWALLVAESSTDDPDLVVYIDPPTVGPGTLPRAMPLAFTAAAALEAEHAQQAEARAALQAVEADAVEDLATVRAEHAARAAAWREAYPGRIAFPYRLKRFSDSPCTAWARRGTSACTNAGGPMQAYSMDLRERALLDSDAGMKAADVAVKYRVSGSWVRLLKQRRRETGEVAPRVQRHGRRRMLEPHLHTLAALIAEQPDRTLAELKDALGTPASLATIWRAVAALDVTVKKNGPALRTRST